MDQVSQAGTGKSKEIAKRKKWNFAFPLSMTIREFEDAFKTKEGKKEKKDRSDRKPLYESANGLIINKRTHKVCLYLEKQLSFGVLASYPYVIKSSIEIGDMTTEGFKQCQKHYKNNKDMLILDYSEEPQKRKKDSKNSEKVGEISPSSKLQEKQDKKLKRKFETQENQYLVEEEKFIDSLSDRILCQKEKYANILRKFADDRNHRAATIMVRNKDLLLYYESLANETTNGEVETREKETKLLQREGEVIEMVKEPSIEIEESEDNSLQKKENIVDKRNKVEKIGGISEEKTVLDDPSDLIETEEENDSGSINKIKEITTFKEDEDKTEKDEITGFLDAADDEIEDQEILKSDTKNDTTNLLGVPEEKAINNVDKEIEKIDDDVIIKEKAKNESDIEAEKLNAKTAKETTFEEEDFKNVDVDEIKEKAINDEDKEILKSDTKNDTTNLLGVPEEKAINNVDKEIEKVDDDVIIEEKAMNELDIEAEKLHAETAKETTFEEEEEDFKNVDVDEIKENAINDEEIFKSDPKKSCDDDTINLLGVKEEKEAHAITEEEKGINEKATESELNSETIEIEKPDAEVDGGKIDTTLNEQIINKTEGMINNINEEEKVNSVNKKTKLNSDENIKEQIRDSLLKKRDPNAAGMKRGMKKGNEKEEEKENDIVFKLEDFATYEAYKQKHANLSRIVGRKYLSKRGAKTLAQNGWNYYQVVSLETKGFNHEEIIDLIKKQKTLEQFEPDLNKFLKTLAPPKKKNANADKEN